ncbi:DUF2634 domain-containing protein [Bavariicoccus seileri]|uniref:DUF2634 domain-containing protein n=1 Tax=Bavariicoccus seileri TaxID=549685 RepID=UPI0003B5CABA|nr:DUF2634 domain-containing protein [Bavariicoccus seileri]
MAEELDEGLLLEDAIEDEEIIDEPTKTYRVFNNRIAGNTNDLEAVAQAIDKILNTERFAYPIYSDNYGIEFETLIGQDYDLVNAEIERIVTEALSADERVIDIADLKLEKIADQKDSATLLFTVNTVYGQLNYEGVIEV